SHGTGRSRTRPSGRGHYARGMARLRVAAAQINVTVGDLAGNVERIVAGIDAAEAAGVDLLAFPELAVSGYRPEDLLLRPAGVAVSVCEGGWTPTGPSAAQAAGGAELAVNINASPYYEGRIAERATMLATRAADHSVPILSVNLVGGQDELVFDGGSAIFDESGHLV